MTADPTISPRRRRWPAVLLLAAAVLAYLVLSRAWQFGPRDRVHVAADSGPGWIIYLTGAATRDEGERVGKLLERIPVVGPNPGAAVLSRQPGRPPELALVLDPTEAGGMSAGTTARELHAQLVQKVFPGETPVVRVCAGPLAVDPKGPPAEATWTVR